MENEDLIRLSTVKHKSNQIGLNLFGTKSEEVFNKKKEDLDKYRYRLIQVKDPDLAQDLYLKLESHENEFSELEAEHSIILEKNKISKNFYKDLRSVLKTNKVGIFQMRLKKYTLRQKILFLANDLSIFEFYFLSYPFFLH